MRSRSAPETIRSRPSGVLRTAFRLPIHLYKHRLGWLMGHRLVLLTHRGRKSGRIRQTPLEVIRYDPATEESVVVSAWGEKADWYRNVKANPALEIQIGHGRYVPEQRFLSSEETYTEISDYERRHPWLVRTIPRWLGFRLDGTERERKRFTESVRMVAFRPKSKTVPPGRALGGIRVRGTTTTRGFVGRDTAGRVSPETPSPPSCDFGPV